VELCEGQRAKMELPAYALWAIAVLQYCQGPAAQAGAAPQPLPIGLHDHDSVSTEQGTGGQTEIRDELSRNEGVKPA